MERFDANSFLYITKGRRLFRPDKTIRLRRLNGQGLSRAKANFLVVSFTSDWLYPTYQSRAMVKAMKKNGLDVSFCEIEAEWGHDAFLLPNERLNVSDKRIFRTCLQ